MMDKRRLIPLGLVIILFVIWKFQTNSRSASFVELRGTTMGPIEYTIKYYDADKRNYHQQINSLLGAFNQSLSTYISDSEISRFNTADSVVFESPFFHPVLTLSEQIYQLTRGAFDPTIGPLVSAWGFGADGANKPKDLSIDSVKALVGFGKLTFDEEVLSKSQSGVRLDLSAIAKGYAVDLVGEFLERQGVMDYMVEIGGEVRCRGKNAQSKTWRIGIENPKVEITERELFATVAVENLSIATSGNYRNFYELDGKKYSHTISPFTGYPVDHSLLSVSVFTESCVAADALATGFLVMGLEESMAVINELDSVEAYFIYADQEGTLQTLATEGIRKKIKE